MQSIAITVTMISVVDAMHVRIVQKATAGAITAVSAETVLKQSAIVEEVVQIVLTSAKVVPSSAKIVQERFAYIVVIV